MTLVGFDTRISSHAPRMPRVANPLGILMTAAHAVNRWRTRRADARALEALPFDLRKDLGWPSADGNSHIL